MTSVRCDLDLCAGRAWTDPASRLCFVAMFALIQLPLGELGQHTRRYSYADLLGELGAVPARSVVAVWKSFKHSTKRVVCKQVISPVFNKLAEENGEKATFLTVSHVFRLPCPSLINPAPLRSMSMRRRCERFKFASKYRLMYLVGHRSGSWHSRNAHVHGLQERREGGVAISAARTTWLIAYRCADRRLHRCRPCKAQGESRLRMSCLQPADSAITPSQDLISKHAA